jgi:hypothetical protein
MALVNVRLATRSAISTLSRKIDERYRNGHTEDVLQCHKRRPAVPVVRAPNLDHRVKFASVGI